MTRHPTGTRAGESLDRAATDSYAAIRHLEVRLDPTLALPPGGRAGR